MTIPQEPAAPTRPPLDRNIGAMITSVFASTAFLVAFVVAYFSKDQTNLSLLVGAIISNFTTVVNFWLGSSLGSRQKDAEIAKMSSERPLSTVG